MTGLAPFLAPQGFVRPSLTAVLREASVLGEGARSLVRHREDCRARRSQPVTARPAPRAAEPVLLVPGFLAGDTTLGLLGRSLRAEGFRTYRSRIHANVACTVTASTMLERRLEAIVMRRGARVWIVGHSLGGMLARGLAVRRPDLVAGIVTMGSPMLAPGAHHLGLSAMVEMLVRLSRAGLPGLMAEDCVAGECARSAFEEARQPLPSDVQFVAIYSRRDGIVDWRACVDPLARPIEVVASHLGMAVDPRVRDHVVDVLRGASKAQKAQNVTLA